jgi:GxxExxY protein
MKIQLAPELERLTERIIGAAFEVSGSLGHGFLEAVYKKALLLELSQAGLSAVTEVPYRIHYRSEHVGTYLADIVVNTQVILELKAVESLTEAHRGQLLNYLRASGCPVGLLLNFGKPRLEIRRVLP